MKLWRSALFVLVLSLAITASAAAQGFTGQIVGTVTDQTKAVLPGVTITVTNTGTAASREVVTNEAGGFNVPALPAGTYRVEAQLTGFRTEARTGVTVQVNQIARVNFDMSVGDVSQTVEVTGTAPLIETDSAALGQVVDRKKIDDLPLNGRSFVQLSTLATGVVPLSQGENTAARGGNVHINGGREWQNNFILDGVDNNDLANGEIRLLPSVDALAEFKVQTSTFAAEYGRATGGVVNLTTRSGTNEIHGTAFEFLRNDNLDAKNTFAPTKPEFKRNQFGATVGGPVIKDKSFFFFNYEGARVVNARSRGGLLPTAAMKQGNFSQISTPIIDPQTGSQFPGNVIPSNRITARSQAFLATFPDPQVASVTGNNYFANAPFTQNVDQFTARVDYRFNSNQTFFGRYTLSDDFALDPNPRVPVPGFGDDVIKNPQSLSLFLTSVMTPTLVMETKFGYSRSNTAILEELGSRTKFWAKSLGLSETQAFSSTDERIQKFPDLAIAGYDAPRGNNGGFARFHNNWHYSEAVSWTRGTHAWKFGGEFRREGMNLFFPSNTAGTYTFDRSFTGNNFADFLLGYLGSVQRKVGDVAEHERGNFISVFWQDDWKAGRKLTLNYGMRYEIQMPLHEIRHLWSRWNFATGKLERLGDDTPSPSAWLTDKNNFGPRLGLAYDLNGDGKTVVRTGIGVFYDALLHNYPYTMFLSPPVSVTDTRATSAYNGIPFTQPFPAPAVIAVTPTTGIQTIFPDSKNTYNTRWSLSIQRALRENLLLDAAYVGSHSVRDRLTSNQNQPLVIGDANTRPYPQIGAINTASTDGLSSFHSGQLKIEQREMRGLTYIASYTWSKGIDVGGNSTFGNASGPQDNYDRIAGERGLVAFDHRHRLVVNTIYDLPLKITANNIAEKLVNGWQVNSIVTIQSGNPISIIRQTTLPGFSGGNNLRPDQVCDPNIDVRTPERWFATECFVNPGNRYGTAGRATVTTPGQNQWDISLLKNVAMTDRVRMQFRAEFFNAFNRPQYFSPNVTFTIPANNVIGGTTPNASFGKISQAGDARQIQLGLKLYY